MAAPSSTLKAALVVSLLAHAVLLAWGRWSLTPTPSALTCVLFPLFSVWVPVSEPRVAVTRSAPALRANEAGSYPGTAGMDGVGG